jgi:hypothetical protein
MKPRAFCYIRDLPHYRRSSFVSGLAAAGFDIPPQGTTQFRPGDVAVVWNRYGEYDRIATTAEKAGAVVFVTENGFVGRDREGRQFYQLAIGGHNGSGWWRVGAGDRLRELGITPVRMWQAENPNGHIVVRGQRGIGRPGMGSPPNWHIDMANRLREKTKRRILVVPHPGNGAVDDQRHVEYLAGAHALVVWSSSVGVKALVMGVPVISDARYWVCKPTPSVELIEADFLRSDANNKVRHEMLHRMAWAQWSLDEIASGHPFRFLLDGYQAKLQPEEAHA